MTIRYIASPRGGQGKSHVAVMLGHLLPDAVVIEQEGANDAKHAFAASTTIRFTGDEDSDLLALESAIGKAAGHQNIVVNFPPSRGIELLKKHADLVRQIGEQFGHQSELMMVVGKEPIFNEEAFVQVIGQFGSACRIIFNNPHGRPEPEMWLFTERMGPAAEAAGARLYSIARAPREVANYIMGGKASQAGLALRVLTARYIESCQHLTHKTKHITNLGHQHDQQDADDSSRRQRRLRKIVNLSRAAGAGNQSQEQSEVMIL